MAHFYIEPRYNSGEKVAGGTLAIYANESMQVLADLYRVADFSNPVDGTVTEDFIIANPVPIDNNGINSSPIFIDLDVYPSAYYVLRDARNAIIRQGYLVPMSWQGGSQPPAGGDNGWGGTSVGDPFWGYEVITGLNSGTNPLLRKSTDIGRPLYLSTSVPGDKSGGLIVWAVDTGYSTGDNILTFTGNNGRVWKAREEYINSSYLIANGKDVAWLENAYKGQYNINLDQCFTSNNSTSGTVVNFSGKVRLAKKLTDTSNGVSYTINLKPDNLEILVQNAISMTNGSNNVPLTMFQVAGGTFKATQIAGVGAIGTLFVTGTIDNLYLDAKVKLSGLKIKWLQDGADRGVSMDPGSIDDTLQIDRCDHTCIKSIPFNYWPSIKELNANGDNYSIDLSGSNGINFNCIGNNVILTASEYAQNGGIANAYFIKPSKNFVVDYTFYAKNAELYNVCQFSNNVVIYSGNDNNGNGGGSLPAVISNHLVRLDSECYGKIILNSTNSNKLYLNSRTVEVDGDDDYYIYLGSAWGNLTKANVIADFNLMAGRSIQNNVSTKEYRTYGSTARQCKFIIGSYYAPIITANGVIFEGSEIIDSNFDIYCCAVAFSNTKVRGSSFNGQVSYRQSGNYSDTSFPIPGSTAIWLNCVYLYNDSEIAGSKFCRCQIMPINDYKNQMRNIHFDGNQVFDDGQGNYRTYNDANNATKNVYAIIKLLQGTGGTMDDWSGRIVNSVPTDGVSSIKMENVTFKGNLRNSDGAGFSMVSHSGNNLRNRALQGHIEITGDYNYNYMSRMGTNTIVAATETFPPWESGIDYWYNVTNAWNYSGSYVSQLCMFVPGDPVKYTTGDGQFVSVDPFQQMTESITTLQKIYNTWNNLPNAGIFPLLNLPKSQGNMLTGYRLSQGTPNSYFNVNSPTNQFPTSGAVLTGLTQSSQLIVDVLAITNLGNTVYTWEQISNPNNFAVVNLPSSTGSGDGTGTILIGTPAGGTLSAWLFPYNYYETFWGWNYGYPVPRTTGVNFYNWTDTTTSTSGTIIVPICCLLCCNCNVKLYRIRE